MKKTILIMLLILTIGLFACDTPHEHKYVNGECECGEKHDCEYVNGKCECGALEPHTHEYGEWEVVKEATETEEGLKERTCSCGDKQTEKIAKLEHVHNFVEGKCECGETTEVLVESVEISGKTEMNEGEEQTLTIAVLPAYATNKEVVWSSSDDEVATVENGLVKALKAGTVTIKAIAQDGSTKEATIQITVSVNEFSTTELKEKLSSVLEAYLNAQKASICIKMEENENVLNHEYAFELKGENSFVKLYDKLSGSSNVSIFIKDEMIYMNANDVLGKYPIDDYEIADIFENPRVTFCLQMSAARDVA